MNQTLALKQLKILDKYGKKMRLAAEKWSNEFQTLISIILSARTKDETTIKICKILFKKYLFASGFTLTCLRKYYIMNVY